MRVLLLSDPHGDFRGILRLCERTGADAVLVAGDLQMESHEHCDRISPRELYFRVKHSAHRSLLSGMKRSDLPKLHDIVRRFRLLGEWDELLSGQLRLPVPVYAVWGNHEDPEFVRAADAQQLEVPNLHFLNAARDALLDGWIRVNGIGGNILLPDFLGRDLVVRGHKITATLERYAQVFDLWRQREPAGELRVFLQHVSPHKDRACALPLMRIAPDLVVSGHMGAPFPQLFNLYAPYLPADIEPVHRQPAEWLSALLAAMIDAAPIRALLREAEARLASDGPDAFRRRYLESAHPLAARLAAHDCPRNPDPMRRCQVAVDRAREALERESRIDLVAGRSTDQLEQLRRLLEPPGQFRDLTYAHGHRHTAADNTLKRIGSINLPDAPGGYVLLESDARRRSVQIRAHGGLRARGL